MRLDHIIIHIDDDSANFQTLTKTLNAQGYPINPDGGKRHHDFLINSVNIGSEYLEIVRVRRPKSRAWMPLWVSHFDSGKRGAFCIFLELDDAERLGANLKHAGIPARGPATLAYPMFFGLLHRSAPYYIYYMPVFPDSALQLAIMSYKDASVREAAINSLTPNSASNGTNAIRRVEVEIPRLDESLPMLTKIFPDLRQENGEWMVKLEQMRLVFRLSPNAETNVRVRTVTSSRSLVGKKLQIANVELVTAGG